MRGRVLAPEVVLRIYVTVCNFVLEFALTLEIWRSGVVNYVTVCKFVLEFALTLEIWWSGVVNLRNCLQLCARNCAHARDLAI